MFINGMKPLEQYFNLIFKILLSYNLAILPSGIIEGAENKSTESNEIYNLKSVYNSIKGNCNESTFDMLSFVISNLKSLNQPIEYNSKIETALHLAAKKDVTHQFVIY